MEFLQIAVSVLVLMVVFVLGTLYGWNLRERMASRTLRHIAKAVEQKVEEEIKNLIHITIEEHNGTLFVYEKENHTFMAQGSNRDELEKALSTRYPEKRFACDHDTLVKIGFVS